MYIQAGIFRNASSGSTNPEEDFLRKRVVDDEDRTVEMSSENSAGPTRSRSEEDVEGEDHDDDEEEEEDGTGNKGNKRKRKKYHRHTTDQIRHMEAYVLPNYLATSYPFFFN